MRAKRHVLVVDNSHVAHRIGDRIRVVRLRAHLTQAQVAKGRYTPAYISALERGLAKPSMAALTFISERLGVAVTDLVADETPASARLEADLLLAAGRHQEALDAYEVLLERANQADQLGVAEIQRGRAEALCRLGRGAEAIRPASGAAETFARLGLAGDAAWARYWLAFAHYLEDNPAEARSLLLGLLADERGGLKVAPDFRFRLLTALGLVESWDGEPDRALTYMEEARMLSAGLALRQRAAFLSGLTLQYRQAGDLERSLRAGIESLALFRASEAELDEAGLANNLALTYLQFGNLERAAEHAMQARSVAERHDDLGLLSDIADTEAQIAWARGDTETAEERVAFALEAAHRAGRRVAEANAHLTRARMQRDRDEVAAAVASYAEAASGLRQHGPRGLLRDLLAEWAEMLEGQGDLAAAARLYAEALGREGRQTARGSTSRVGTGRRRARIGD